MPRDSSSIAIRPAWIKVKKSMAYGKYMVGMLTIKKETCPPRFSWAYVYEMARIKAVSKLGEVISIS